MPELPEVETTRRGIRPFLVNQSIASITVRQRQLRLPIPADLDQLCRGQVITEVSRRSKYLILHLTQGYLLIHLGMSGHLRISPADITPKKHDHIDLNLANGQILRYNDPRRFGLWLHLQDDPQKHRLLANLGPEPLSDLFTPDYLALRAEKKSKGIKAFIMDNANVVGIGNIYATESLYLAGIHPQTPAGQLKRQQFIPLVNHIRQVLEKAIKAGGTTLRDFYAADGKPGYFANDLQVYGRKNQPCFVCETPIQTINIAGRSSAFCPGCQVDNGIKR